MTDVRRLIAQGAQVPLVPPPGEDPLQAALADLRAGDPPGFFLQASPSYQGGTLPDGVWQRVPLGGVGQVLTVQADGSVNWQNNPAGFVNPLTVAGDIMYESAAPAATRLPIGAAGQVLTVVSGFPAWATPVTGFANPMIALGDMISGSGGGAAVRLSIGTSGQVLTVSGGVPTWQNATAGFTNPMTTAGDIIFENATPAPARLAIGTNGQVLTISGGLPTWQNASAGFTNPMTTLGDIITAAGGGAAQRLGIGLAGQVLGVSAGVPAWVNSPSGFANPMTGVGDMISGTTGGAAQRLAAGSNGQFMVMVNGAPTWQTQPSITVAPSGDTTGVQDIANFNAAFAALSNAGTVQLLPNATYYIGAAGISIPPYATLRGGGQTTVINCVGNGTGTYILMFNSASPSYTRLSGNLFDFLIDGTGAGNGAIGIQLQDTNGVQLRLGVRNFSGAGSIGVQFANNTHSLNQVVGYIAIVNCTNAITFTALGAQTAIEHIYLILSIQINAGQNGIVLHNSVGVQGSELKANIGVLSANAGNCIQFDTSCVFADTHFVFKAELTSAAVTAQTVSFNGAGSGFSRTTGMLFFSTNLLTSNVGSGGKVVHFGTIIGDSTMTAVATPPSTPPGLGTYDLTTVTTPGFPASGVAVTNNSGVPVFVTVAGGTLTTPFGQVNGATVGDANTRAFMVPRSQTIALTYSGAPSGWTWQAVG